MVREIVIFGDPVLRKKCSKVESFSEEVSSLVKDMIETMVSAEGIGLAFQIRDDIIDIESPASESGKPQGSDVMLSLIHI